MQSIPPDNQQAGDLSMSAAGDAGAHGGMPPMAAPPMAADAAGQSAAAAWLPPTVPVSPGHAAAAGSVGQMGANGLSAPIVPVPEIADDGDIIEKEWVDKAKHIVATTRHDPYKQARELHRFKAEYLQKRYNKTIEVVED